MNFQYQCAANSVHPVRIALAIGVFDGVHRGHQKILQEIRALAERRHAIPSALTFSPHPRTVLANHEPPALLCSLSARAALLKQYGAENVEVMKFTPELAQLEPDSFLKLLRSDPKVHLCGICVGTSWRFGAGGLGDAEFLRHAAERDGFEFSAVEPLKINGETVSSSAIRRAVASGLLEKARLMLGRPYSLTGRVEGGHRAASRELGFPTANLEIKAGILPPDGVYAGCVTLADGKHPAAVNIGLSPTFDWSEHARRVEAHIFDFSGDLYGHELEVSLLEHIRPERAFADAAELAVQIGKDIEHIRAAFGKA